MKRLRKIRPKSRNEICFSTMTYSIAAILVVAWRESPLVHLIRFRFIRLIQPTYFSQLIRLIRNGEGNSGTADSTTKAGGELIFFC